MCWSGWPNCCLRGSRCASSPTGALATKSCTGCSTEELYFDYVIRFRGNIAVTANNGETRSAAAWLAPVGALVCCAAPGHRRSLPGGNRGLCSGSRHEASVVPGRRRHRCYRQICVQHRREARAKIIYGA